MRHKIGLLREADISTKKFRELTGELARLLAYEATADFPLAKVTINCWSGLTEIEQIAGRKVTVVPILRAGLGMLDGVLDMVPNAKVSVVGLSRNHETLQPENYFEKFVGKLEERTALNHRPDARDRGLDDCDCRAAPTPRLQGHPRAGAGGCARRHCGARKGSPRMRAAGPPRSTTT